MGILHEILIAIGVVLLLVIAWSATIAVRESWNQAEETMQAVSAPRMCHGAPCAVQTRG